MGRVGCVGGEAAELVGLGGWAGGKAGRERAVDETRVQRTGRLDGGRRREGATVDGWKIGGHGHRAAELAGLGG